MDNFDEQLIELAAKYHYDPVGFAKFAFHWGEGDLAEFDGLDTWQEDFLRDFAHELSLGEAGVPIPRFGIEDDEDFNVRMAVSSGHGTGKTALISITILWYMVTRSNANVRVTANSEAQLRSTTWPELALWNTRCIFGHWFKWEATRFSKIGARETWYAEAITWNEANPAAFAGKHGRYYLTIYDEAAGIPSVIWETTRGSMTTKGNTHLAFGNPIFPSGGFFDIFHTEKRNMWNLRHINSLETKHGNSSELRAIVREYGPDHDVTRRRVLGQFPRQAARQFISTETVERAIERRIEPIEYENFPIYMGIDVAHFGDDRSVIVIRQGPRLLQIHTFEGMDTVELTNVAIGHLKSNPNISMCFVDATGIGVGVSDMLARWTHKVQPVQVGRRPTNQKLYKNLRVEIWDKMRAWLDTADLPDNPILRQELTQIEYDYTDLGQMRLEKKVAMKARGIPSPDIADALAFTFCRPDAAELEYFEDDDEGWNSTRRLDGRSRVTGY